MNGPSPPLRATTLVLSALLCILLLPLWCVVLAGLFASAIAFSFRVRNRDAVRESAAKVGR